MSDYMCENKHICKPRNKCHICGAKARCVDPFEQIDNPESMSEEAERDMGSEWGKE